MQDGLHGVVRFLTKGQTKEAYPLVVGTDAGIPFLLPLEGKGKVPLQKLNYFYYTTT